MSDDLQNVIAMHERFALEATLFKRALEARSFTDDEIASMLGSFVLAFYEQKIATPISPDQAEFLSKNTLLAERMLEEMHDG